MISFGPVPSRRLGRSLGVNNIPPKTCTYACVYCQVGRTTEFTSSRREFYDPDEVWNSVSTRVREARSKDQPIDYVTFVPDGEPTLDVNLGEAIRRVRDLGIRVAVISNGSLLSEQTVRRTLAMADWVSVKLDAVTEPTWRHINRPHRALDLDTIIDGVRHFAESFEGQFVTETMLVEGLNDNEAVLEPVADLAAELQPDTAYLSIPTRPPAEKWVQPPSEHGLALAYQLFSDRVQNVEHLVGYEGNTFASTGDAKNDILSITAVHPMRRGALAEFLREAGKEWSVVQELLEEGALISSCYRGHEFFVRSLPGRTPR